MKRPNKSLLTPILLLLFSLFAALSIEIPMCYLSTDQSWSAARVIQSIEKSEGNRFLSGFITSGREEETFYGAGYFYDIQKAAFFWDVDGPSSNNLFFKYTHDDTNRYSVTVKTKDGDSVGVDLFVPLRGDSAARFPLKLAYGSKVNAPYYPTACQECYMSSELAELLGIHEGNVADAELNLSLWRGERRGADSILSKVNGVVSPDIAAPYGDYFTSPYYLLTSWSPDLQMKVVNPEFHVMFGNDLIKNQRYLDSILNPLKKNPELSFHLSDAFGRQQIGVFDEKLKQTMDLGTKYSAGNLLPILGFTVFSLGITVLLVYLLRKKRDRYYPRVLAPWYEYVFIGLSFFAAFALTSVVFPVGGLAWYLCANDLSSVLTVIITVLVMVFWRKVRALLVGGPYEIDTDEYAA